jgi:galactokinase
LVFIKNKTITTRCPGRLSLSKHADYINSHLLYLLDNRETNVTGYLTDGDGKLILENREFSDRVFLQTEIKEALNNKLDWSFYVLSLIDILQINLSGLELKLSIKSNIPIASGLSSSHALILSCLRNLVEIFNLKDFKEAFKNPLANKKTMFAIIKLCQSIEENRGFKSGLGDQCAQIFSKKGFISSIKIFPDLEINYIKIPEEIDFVTIPSYQKADKNEPEFIEKNKKLEKYKTLNSLVSDYNCTYLADLHLKISEKEIFDFLDGFDDKLLQGLALYGLAESKRTLELSKNFSISELGKHLNLSHQAEKNYDFSKEEKQEISEADKLNFVYDRKLKLKEHYGYYHASTLKNDLLQNITANFTGVFGSSITGAGFGGNNIAVVSKTQSEALKEYLIKNFYENFLEIKKPELLHISQSNNGLSLI